MKKRNVLGWMAASAGLALTGGLLSACSENKPRFAAIDLTGANYARDFALTDHHGQPRSLQDFAGKVVVLFFGYAQCPDVCPTTMAELAEVKKLLGKEGERVQGLFVTLDPERDTPEVLKAYMGNFDPSFLALYGSPETLAATAKEYKIYFQKAQGKTPTSYTLDHSAGSYVYDSRGKLRLYARYGTGAAALAADIGLLLQAAS